MVDQQSQPMIKTYISSLRPAKLFQTLMRPFMLLVMDHTDLNAYKHIRYAYEYGLIVGFRDLAKMTKADTLSI